MSDENLDFAAFMQGENAKYGDDCHNYGITYGCDEGCPQMLRGDCPVPNENKEIIRQAGVEHKYQEQEQP